MSIKTLDKGRSFQPSETLFSLLTLTVVVKSVTTGFKLHALLMTVITTLEPKNRTCYVVFEKQNKNVSALMKND